ncbi:MAG: type IV pilus modification PilV family protein [Planctomycetota bacterium]
MSQSSAHWCVQGRTLRPAPRRARRGLSLLEVLISSFVLSIGLLGVAALLPVGGLAIEKTNVSDRCGTAGRAALREMRVRRMLDWQSWSADPDYTPIDVPGAPNRFDGDEITIVPFVIDPLGVARFDTNTGNNEFDGCDLFGNLLPRLSLARNAAGNPLTPAQAEAIFVCSDDPLFQIPADVGYRPLGQYETSAGGLSTNPAVGSAAMVGNFSWFLTVFPSRLENFNYSSPFNPIQLKDQKQFQVSAVICYRRSFDMDGGAPTAEYWRDVSFPGGGWSGAVKLEDASGNNKPIEELRANEWVLLVDDTNARQCAWYRVVSSSLGAGSPPEQQLTLMGPDWHVSAADTRLIYVQGVVGVYTTMVDIDRDPLWLRKN